MEQLKNEQTVSETQTAAAEEINGVTKEQVSLGKFKDVNALIHAYNSLQAEFTKRCQRIKELEGAVNSVDKTTAPNEQSADELEPHDKGITQEERQQILKDYLKSVVSSKQTAILMDGSGMGLKTPVSKPKTIAEAGALAIEILK